MRVRAHTRGAARVGNRCAGIRLAACHARGEATGKRTAGPSESHISPGPPAMEGISVTHTDFAFYAGAQNWQTHCARL